MDPGGGQVVSKQDLYSNDPSLNPTEVSRFSAAKLLKNNENKLKEAGDGLLKNFS